MNGCNIRGGRGGKSWYYLLFAYEILALVVLNGLSLPKLDQIPFVSHPQSSPLLAVNNISLDIFYRSLTINAFQRKHEREG